MKDHLKEILGTVLTGLSAFSGWVVLVNVYLQFLAFVLSILVAILTIRSLVKKERTSNESKRSELDRPK